jgi:glycosyltransferase involved in cell wall biosynthesis
LAVTARAPITAVIPCRNAAPYIAEAVRSARAQTRAVEQIVVVDDGSTDGSGEIAQAAGATVLRLRAHAAEAAGNGAARNAGIRAANTELIALLDADDVWLPEHCERVAALLDRYPDACAGFGAMRVVGTGTGVHTPIIEEGAPRWLFERCVETWIGQPSSCVIRRSAALAIGGFDETLPLGVDFDMWLRLSRRFPFVATHEITGLYRRHADQISNRRVLQIEMCFRSRRRMHDALVAEGDATRAEQVAAITRSAYQTALQGAWDENNREALATMLAFSSLVPGGESVRRVWARRSAVPRGLLRIWRGAGESMRAPIRRVVHWLESRR